MAESRITWRYIFDSKFPALLAMAKRAGVDTTGWHLRPGDIPVLITTRGTQFCDWSTARECNDQLQAWIDCLSIVELSNLTR